MMPKIEPYGLGYQFTWDAEQISIRVDHFRESSRDGLHAELQVRTERSGFNPVLLTPTSVNLTSTRSRADIAKHLKMLLSGIDWTTLIEYACGMATQYHRRGEPALALSSVEQVTPATFRLHPLIFDRMPTVLFGPGGGGKSYLALFLALLVDKGGYFGRFCGMPGRVLYLDWEADERVLAYRRQQLLLSHADLGTADVVYKRMYRPLSEELVEIQRLVRKHGIQLLILDSLALAAGGDLMSAETAIRLHGALRTLNIASLSIAHVAKNANEEARSIFGSVFFTNLARSVFEVRSSQDEGAGVRKIVLYHKKTNEGGIQRPIGLSLSFGQGVTVAEMDIEEAEELSRPTKTVDRIKRALQDGNHTVKAISEATSLDEATVRTRLNEGRNRWSQKKNDREWDLAG
jgi:hypothetical protein